MELSQMETELTDLKEHVAQMKAQMEGDFLILEGGLTSLEHYIPPASVPPLIQLTTRLGHKHQGKDTHTIIHPLLENKRCRGGGYKMTEPDAMTVLLDQGPTNVAGMTYAPASGKAWFHSSIEPERVAESGRHNLYTRM